MPQIKAAKKALRQSQRRRAVNDRWRRKLREVLNAIRDAVQAGQKSEAETAFQKAQSILDRAARHHVIPAHKAARKKSRLKQAISKL